MRRGQTLSYDAIGAAGIFLVAVGLLLTNWSYISERNTYNRSLIIEAQRGLEKLENQILVDGYQLNWQIVKDCKIDPAKAGIVDSYYLAIQDASGTVHECGTKPGQDKARGIADRIYLAGDKPVRVRLIVYGN